MTKTPEPLDDDASAQSALLTVMIKFAVSQGTHATQMPAALMHLRKQEHSTSAAAYEKMRIQRITGPNQRASLLCSSSTHPPGILNHEIKQ